MLLAIEGSGKGTQTRLLVERLAVYAASISFPQYGQTSSSNLITKYLNGQRTAIFRVQVV